MATLGAATLDDGSAGARAHTVTEAVLAFAAAYIGLISAFHSKRSPGRGVRGRR